MSIQTFRIKNIETGEVQVWDAKRVLAEINRDRYDEWMNYDEDDDIRGAWHIWVEDGEPWRMLDE
jgi:hypothetical protein